MLMIFQAEEAMRCFERIAKLNVYSISYAIQIWAFTRRYAVILSHNPNSTVSLDSERPEPTNCICGIPLCYLY